MSDLVDPVRPKPRVPLTSQAIAFWKNWWALLWRLAVMSFLIPALPWPTVLFYLSGIGAAVLAFGVKTQIRRRAVLGLFTFQSPVAPLVPSYRRHEGIYRGGAAATGTTSRTTISTSAPSVPVIDQPTGPGRITGYEPRALDDMAIPSRGDHTLMSGSPGSGLSESGFDAKAVELGQAGEANFAKALDLNGALDKYATFWSVDRPDWNGDLSGADVDCVVLTGNTLWLLDMKFYKGGDATYKSHGTGLYLYDNPTGSQIGQPKTMSRNMEIAAEVFSKMLNEQWKASGRFSVRSLVVLIPTNAGAPSIETGTAWPGGVRLENLDTFLTSLMIQPAFDPNDRFGKPVRDGLRRLVKSA